MKILEPIRKIHSTNLCFLIVIASVGSHNLYSFLYFCCCSCCCFAAAAVEGYNGDLLYSSARYFRLYCILLQPSPKEICSEKLTHVCAQLFGASYMTRAHTRSLKHANTCTHTHSLTQTHARTRCQVEGDLIEFLN